MLSSDKIALAAGGIVLGGAIAFTLSKCSSNTCKQETPLLNHLDTLPAKLRNRYYIMRHGESEANKLGIVSSTFRVSIAQHGLTEKGVAQASSSGEPVKRLLVASDADLEKKEEIPSLDSENILYYASDFARAYETAFFSRDALVSVLSNSSDSLISSPAGHLSASRPRLFTHPSLRERSFGDFEGGSHDSYHKVWEQDKVQTWSSNHYNVESIASVVDRTTRFIKELESTWSNKHIILVSHGDVCQILQSAFLGIDPRTHRSLQHMNNCDVRPLKIAKPSASSSS